jgi:hypothetical protein
MLFLVITNYQLGVVCCSLGCANGCEFNTLVLRSLYQHLLGVLMNPLPSRRLWGWTCEAGDEEISLSNSFMGLGWRVRALLRWVGRLAAGLEEE